MLVEKLQALDESDVYPFHMPGHKRRLRLPADAYQLDITEIDGFDNLHHAMGILKEEQEKLAAYLGAKRTFFLVNGSTCGILAAISAVAERGERILLARNSHKAAYHAVELRGLLATYCYPRITGYDIQGAISPEEISQALREDPSIRAVYVTSPTYDGVVSDISRIADLAHEYGVPLIVDEAHGAHFGLHETCPASAISCGADVVIQSVHKTLPAFTQSALLHVCSERVSEEGLAHFLGIYETSSPSYLLLAGMSRLVPFLQEQGESLFTQLDEHLNRFYERSSRLNALHVLGEADFTREEAFAKDRTKILISTAGCDIDGLELYERLLRDYRLQPEMCSGEYVTALCSIMDTAEGFERLLAALEEIDGGLIRKDIKFGFVERMYRKREQVCSIAQALEQKNQVRMEVPAAGGCISAEYVYLYPPGIPLLVPGERIDPAFPGELLEVQRRGLSVEGLRDTQARCIWVMG